MSLTHLEKVSLRTTRRISHFAFRIAKNNNRVRAQKKKTNDDDARTQVRNLSYAFKGLDSFKKVRHGSPLERRCTRNSYN